MESSKNLDVAPHSQRKRRRQRRHHPAPDDGAGASSDSDPPPPPSSPGSVRCLIEPYSKPRIVSILAEAAAADPALRARLRAAADASPSHRRLFVHGLPPRADAAALADAFSGFGSAALAECHAVADRASGGRCKGYGFVTFASRAAARRALRGIPGVRVAGCPVSAQFASAGPTPDSSSGGGGGGAGRRVYVTNVAPDACADRLRAFFARFGELDGGPFGFDAGTGRSRGYALFVYRAAAGAAKAVEEPYLVFEGRALRCQLANEPARRGKAPVSAAAGSAASAPPPPPPPPRPAAAAQAPELQPVLDAVVAAGVGDLEAYARNPAQAAALLGQNPVLAAAVLSSALASAKAARSAAAVASAPIPVTVASPSAPMPVAAEVPSPVKVGVPNGSAGLLGPYKPPSSTAVSSSSGKNGTMVGT